MMEVTIIPFPLGHDLKNRNRLIDFCYLFCSLFNIFAFYRLRNSIEYILNGNSCSIVSQ